MAIGAFASQGYFDLGPVFIFSILTNVFADILGYFITYKYGELAIRKLKIGENKYYLKVKDYVKRYDGITVFVTRISTPFGPLVNFISGLYEVPFRKFITFDILGNLVDFSFYMLLGYWLGNYWQYFVDAVGSFGEIIIIIAVIVIVLTIYARGKNRQRADTRIS
jgi:membrane protein DedA with SNARE-associated domain